MKNFSVCSVVFPASTSRALPALNARLPKHSTSSTRRAWPKIDMNIYKSPNSRSVMWTSIDPFSFANAKEKTPFCSLSI